MANNPKQRTSWMTKINEAQSPVTLSTFDMISSWVVLFLATAMLGPAIVFPSGGQVTPTILLLGWMIGQVVVLAYLFVTLRRKPENVRDLKLAPSSQPIPFLLLIGAGLILTLDVIAAVFTQQFLPAPELIGAGTGGVIDWVLAIVFMVIIQPITEEIVFRGIALPKLRELMGGRNGWIASAIIFAIFHAFVFGTQLTGSLAFWFAFILPLLTGLFIGAVRITTRSTRAAIFVRIGTGIFAVLSAFILAS